jgi:hypothetical protein
MGERLGNRRPHTEIDADAPQTAHKTLPMVVVWGEGGASGDALTV